MFKKIANIGVTGETPLDHNLKIINVITIIAGTFVYGYILIFGALSFFDFESYFNITISMLAYCWLFITPFYFTKRRRHIAAGINIVLAGIYAANIETMLVFGREPAVHYFAIAIPALALLIFNRREDFKYFISLSILNTFCFILSEFILTKALLFPLPPEFPIYYLRVINTIGTIIFVGISVYVFAYDLNNAREKISQESERANKLLLNILPEPIADRLKNDTQTIADGFGSASVLFADMVGFTKMASRYNPEDLVKMLNKYFSVYDRLTEKYKLEKIKTIGDAYMVAAGIPEKTQDHAKTIVEFAREMLEATNQISGEDGDKVDLRIGINSGPVIAGVIGTKKYIYDLWGDAVNLASRMEAYGVPGRIHVTADTYNLLKSDYHFEQRDKIDIKGKGFIQTYLLTEQGKKRYPAKPY